MASSVISIRIARHSFTAWCNRPGNAFSLTYAKTVRVRDEVGCSVVEMEPSDPHALISALKQAIEPGESIVSGSQSFSVVRCRLAD